MSWAPLFSVGIDVSEIIFDRAIERDAYRLPYSASDDDGHSGNSQTTA
jgi:hypothetical protein